MPRGLGWRVRPPFKQGEPRSAERSGRQMTARCIRHMAEWRIDPLVGGEDGENAQNHFGMPGNVYALTRGDLAWERSCTLRRVRSQLDYSSPDVASG